MSDKWLFPAIVAAMIAVVALLFVYGDDKATISISSEPSSGNCSYANSFTDASGQTWSVTDIEAENVGCMEAIKVAIERGEESVGLHSQAVQMGYEAIGWTCDSACTRGEEKVSFSLTYEGG